MEKMDFKDIRYKIETEFHLLRHFSGISGEDEKRMLDVGYTHEQIQEQLALPGSRFYASFAQDLTALIRRLEKANIIYETGSNGNIICTATFSKEEFPNGIGNVSIKHTEEIESSLLKKIYVQPNRGILMNHLDVSELPATRQCSIILSQNNGNHLVVSAYPGPPGMPVPNENMPPDLYNRCKKFWDEHVFLVKKSHP
jgi:hypothetical protein